MVTFPPYGPAASIERRGVHLHRCACGMEILPAYPRCTRCEVQTQTARTQRARKEHT